jgi:hypothetical protein
MSTTLRTLLSLLVNVHILHRLRLPLPLLLVRTLPLQQEP